jgi:DNA replication protein DnaC
MGREAHEIVHEWRETVRQKDPVLASSFSLEGDEACAACHGIGFLTKRTADGYSTELVPCDCSMARNRMRFGGIPEGELYESMTFDSLEGERVEPVKAALKALVEGQPYGGIERLVFVVLAGDSGLAKTHLTVAAVKHAIELGRAARLVYVPDLLNELQSLIERKEETADRPQERLARYAEIEVLALDDFGVENSASSWKREQLDVLINRRYMTMRPTMITYNPELVEIPKRIYDRIYDSRFSVYWQLEGRSYRQGG